MFLDPLASTECISGSANDGIARDETTADNGPSGRCFSQAARRQCRVQAEDFVEDTVQMRQLL